MTKLDKVPTYVVYGINAPEIKNILIGGRVSPYDDIAQYMPGIYDKVSCKDWKLECEVDAGRIMKNVRR